MSVLVDTSVWIDYFRNNKKSDGIDVLIEENRIVTNALILAELIPPLQVRNQKRLILLLKTLKQYPITVDWDNLVEMQVVCLRNGINAVGLPDLMIAQNAIHFGICLLSEDKHFTLIAKHLPLVLFK